MPNFLITQAINQNQVISHEPRLPVHVCFFQDTDQIPNDEAKYPT